MNNVERGTRRPITQHKDKAWNSFLKILTILHWIETSFIVYKFTDTMWNLHNTELYRSWHINHQQETLWKQRVNYFHFALLYQLLSESIVYIVIKEHYANCYCWTSFKKLSWYTVQNCKHSVCTRTCKSLPTFDAKIYFVQIRCYMVTICRKRNDKIVYEIKKIYRKQDEDVGGVVSGRSIRVVPTQEP